MIRHHFELRETVATVLADTDDIITSACIGLQDARFEIERYILSDPFFRSSYEPVPVKNSPDFIKRMAIAAESAKVGPMAAVAGAVAFGGIRKAIQDGAGFCVVDNGGDIALITDRTIRIGLYAGSSPLSGRYAFLIQPGEEIYGICTSSATVGHSFSFGSADSVTVFSSDPILADAVATAVCNTLTLEDQSCLDQVDQKIDGIFAVFNDKSIIWGETPPLVPAVSKNDLITAGGTGFLTGMHTSG